MPNLDDPSYCLRCGMCQPVCPLYQVERLEQVVARGKVMLARQIIEGNVQSEGISKAIFYNCLDCRACMDVCPAKINISGIIKGMRERIYHEKGDAFLASLVLEHLMPHPERHELFRRTLALYQTLGLPALVNLFPSLRQKGKMLPPISRYSFRREMVKRSQGSALNLGVNRWPSTRKKMGKVAYYIGCATDILYPGVGTATLRMLEYNGYDVAVMLNSTCCGMPQVQHGHVDRARDMAKQNILSAPEDIDFVVTDCATCGSTLRDYPRLLAGTDMEEQASRFAGRTIDISAFLVQHTLVTNPGHLGLRVTYHDPCHLNRAQRVKEQPRELIRMSGCELIEMANSDRCCGGAGTYCLTHFDLSQKLLQQKVNDISVTGAAAIVTGCPACRVQIGYGLTNYYKALPVYHPVELLAMSVGKADQS